MDAISETLSRAAQLGEMRAELDKPIGPIVPISPAQNDGMIYVPRHLPYGEVRAYKPGEAISEAPYHGSGLGTMVRAIHTGKVREMEEFRTLGEGSTPGSYLVPTPLSMRVIDLIRNKAQVINAGAVTIPMESQTLKIARQTGDVTAAWKTENSVITFSDASFDVVTSTAQTLVAGSKLSIEMVEDAINIDQRFPRTVRPGAHRNAH